MKKMVNKKALFIASIIILAISLGSIALQEAWKSELASSIEERNIEKIQYFIDERHLVNARTRNGVPILILALLYKYEDIAKLIIESGADINESDSNGNTPIKVAAENGLTETVELLMKKGGDVNEKFSDGSSALSYSVFNGHIRTSKALLDSGAAVNLPNRYGWTPLFLAAQKNNPEMIEMLLRYGADINANFGSGTALMVAAGNGSVEALHLLIARGADVHATAKNGISALDMATGHDDVLKELLRYQKQFSRGQKELESNVTNLREESFCSNR